VRFDYAGNGEAVAYVIGEQWDEDACPLSLPETSSARFFEGPNVDRHESGP